jgi:hypothetical protein
MRKTAGYTCTDYKTEMVKEHNPSFGHYRNTEEIGCNIYKACLIIDYQG